MVRFQLGFKCLLLLVTLLFNGFAAADDANVTWAQLTDGQRQVLNPLASEWDTLRPWQREKMLDIARDLGELSAKARERKLKVEEMQGGCFTISSLGGIGGTMFTPIINCPEVAILGVSRSSMQPVYDAKTKTFEPRLILPMSLSYDHRVIDGADGARFTSHMRMMLSDVRRLLL